LFRQSIRQRDRSAQRAQFFAQHRADREHIPAAAAIAHGIAVARLAAALAFGPWFIGLSQHLVVLKVRHHSFVGFQTPSPCRTTLSTITR
jgi:hypothetical protein